MSTARASRVFSISFPENLAQQVEQVAREESRTISELFREAFRGYLVEKAHRDIEIARREGAAVNPRYYTQDEIEGFVDEIRAEMFAERTKAAEKAS
jgi:metal-responsive CopG/Arc/MetJ family transcriptional regulator